MPHWILPVATSSRVAGRWSDRTFRRHRRNRPADGSSERASRGLKQHLCIFFILYSVPSSLPIAHNFITLFATRRLLHLHNEAKTHFFAEKMAFGGIILLRISLSRLVRNLSQLRVSKGALALISCTTMPRWPEPRRSSPKAFHNRKVLQFNSIQFISIFIHQGK